MSDPTDPTDASPTPPVERARPRRSRRKRHALIAVGVAFAVLIAGTVGFGVYAYNHLSANIATIDDTQDQTDRPTVIQPSEAAALPPLNILLIGSDTRDRRQRLRRRRLGSGAVRHDDAPAHRGRPRERPGREHPPGLDGGDAVVQDDERRHEQRGPAAVQRGVLPRRGLLRAPYRRAAHRHPDRPLRRRRLPRVPRHGQGARRGEGLPPRGGQRHRRQHLAPGRLRHPER